MFTGQVTNGLKKAGSLRFYKPKFKYIFCDMDGISFALCTYLQSRCANSFDLLLFFFFEQGTLLNSKSQVTARNAEALREARSRGVNIVIATGKVLFVLCSCSTNLFKEQRCYMIFLIILIETIG
jgi:hypothetical protein